MARLPNPGGDNGTWGNILNDFLSTEHNADGSLKFRKEIAQPLALATTAVQQGDTFISVKDAPFNAAGDGITDDTNAIKAAFDAANTAKKPLFFPPGQYVCSWFYKAYPPRVYATPQTVTILAKNTNDATWNFGATSYAASFTVAADFIAGSTTLQLTTTSGLVADDLIYVKDNTLDNGIAQGQTLRIYSVDSSTQITTAEPAYATFKVSAGATVQRLPRNQQGCYVRGFVFKSIAGPTATTSFLRLWYCRDIDIDIEGEGASNPGIILQGCYQFTVKAVARNYYDQTVTGLPQFGYGVNISGPCAHGQVTVNADQVRHALSCNGTPNDISITGIAHGTTNTAWDAHTGGTNIVFNNCQAVGCNGFGFALRGKKQHVHGGLVDNCYGGVFVFDSPGQNEIRDLSIGRTRLKGTDGNTGNGILISNPSDGLTIQNNIIENCQRNGISFRAVGVNSNVSISNNMIRNYGQSLAPNDRCGIQQLSSATFNGASISYNTFEDTQTPSTAQYGIQLASVGTNISIHDNQFLSGITPFNGAGTQGAAKIGSNFKTYAVAGNSIALGSAASITFDASLGDTQHVILTGNVTSSSISNPTDGQVLRLAIVQDAIGGHAFTWPSNITWSGGVPALDTQANQITACSFVYIEALGAWIATGSGQASNTTTSTGPLTSRPSASSVSAGGRYYATDAETEYISDSVTWYPTAGATVTAVDTSANRPVANSGNKGTRFFATDTGQVFYSDGNNWLLVGPDETMLFGGHTLTTGEAIMQRTQATGTITLSNTLLRFTYFTARTTETISQVRYFVTTASTGTPTLCRIGVYSVGGLGDLTLIASVPNDITLYGTTGAIIKSFSAPFAKTRGQRYAIGFLCVTSGGQPVLTGVNLNSTSEAAISPKISGSVGTSDLGASYTAAAIASAASLIQAHLLP
ncbi:MAG TPA: right-handed parallel beta-helix repeat-containing protein [Candidatus Saccharimonadales bacterium]